MEAYPTTISTPEIATVINGVSADDQESGLVQNTALAVAPTKDISVERDERFTRIEINFKKEKEMFQNQYSDCYTKTSIVKDRVLETTETHVQKLFVSYDDLKSEELDVVIRDIYVDRFNGEKKTNVKTARKRMRREDFFNALRNGGSEDTQEITSSMFMLQN